MPLELYPMVYEDRTGKVLHLSVHSLTVLRKLHLRSAYSLPAQRNQKTQEYSPWKQALKMHNMEKSSELQLTAPSVFLRSPITSAKRHAHTIRLIKKIIEDLPCDFTEPNFGFSEY